MNETNCYYIAISCGLFPLIVGTTIFVSWLLTGARWLMLAGLYNLGIGILLFIIGFMSVVLIIAYNRFEKRNLFAKTIIPLVLLLSNFPAAATILSTVEYLEKSHMVYVQNNMSEPIDKIVFTDPANHQFVIDDLDPHTKVTKRFLFRGEGTVNYRIQDDSIQKSGMLIGYITNAPSWGDGYLSIEEDGSVKAEHKKRRN